MDPTHSCNSDLELFPQQKKVKDLQKDKKKKGKNKKKAAPQEVSAETPDEGENAEGSSKLVLEVDAEVCGDLRFDFVWNSSSPI